MANVLGNLKKIAFLQKRLLMNLKKKRRKKKKRKISELEKRKESRKRSVSKSSGTNGKSFNTLSSTNSEEIKEFVDDEVTKPGRQNDVIESVIGVKPVADGSLVAIVKYNNSTYGVLPTKDLVKLNPQILVDFYESIIVFRSND